LLESRTEMSEGWFTVSLAHVNLFRGCKLRHGLIDGEAWHGKSRVVLQNVLYF
jgi:hypothetical protein